MELDGPQQKQVQGALISAFPTRTELEQMVFHGLDVHLAAITSLGTLSQVVFELLRWAAAQGRLEELIKVALTHNSGNQELQRVAVQLGVSSDRPSSEESVGSVSISDQYPGDIFLEGKRTLIDTGRSSSSQASPTCKPTRRHLMEMIEGEHKPVATQRRGLPDGTERLVHFAERH